MGVSRADRLRAFLERYEAAPVVWGQDDCSACPARWVEAETGLAVDYPEYASKEDGLVIKENHGGLLPIWEDRLGRVGIFERHDTPRLGDVAIIDTRLWGQIGGIVASGSIILLRKDTGGWHPIGPVRQFVKVWALPE